MVDLSDGMWNLAPKQLKTSFLYYCNAKRGRVVTYHEDFLTIKWHDTLFTLSCEITWQTINAISLLPEWLWPPNFTAGWQLMLKGSYSQRNITVSSRGLRRSRDKVKRLYFHYHSATKLMATKIGWMVTTKSHKALIMWSCEVMWQMKTVIFPPLKCL